MKRFIFILALVCTFFIGCGAIVSAADYPDVSDILSADRTNNYIVCKYADNRTNPYLLVTFTNSSSVRVSVGGSVGSSGLYVYTDYGQTGFRRYAQNGNGWTYERDVLSLVHLANYDSDPDNKWVVCTTVNIKDNISGGDFFLQTPVSTPTPTPEGIAAVQIIPLAITANLRVLIPLGLVVLAILLGVRLVPRLIAFFLR